jgi:hypothetical protein
MQQSNVNGRSAKTPPASGAISRGPSSKSLSSILSLITAAAHLVAVYFFAVGLYLYFVRNVIVEIQQALGISVFK